MAKDISREYELSVAGMRITVLTGALFAEDLPPKADTFHTHEWHEIFYGAEREIYLHFEDRTDVLRAGNIAIMPPDRVHYAEYDLERPPITLSFSVQFPARQDETAKKIAALLSARELFLSPADKTQSALLSFVAEALREEKGTLACAHLFSFLLYTADASPKEESLAAKDSKMGRIYRIDQMIYHYYSGKLSLAEMAEKLHLSPRQLSRIIEKQYGVGYRQKNFELRMQSAARQLLWGKTVEEVAGNVGYQSLSAFHTAFRRRFGTTPAAYRKEHKG